MNRKNALLFGAVLGLAFLTSASATIEGQVGLRADSRNLLENVHQIAPVDELRKDCTVTIDHELPDGGSIKGELIFEDVTWWQCTKMQVAAWWDRNL
jgi:hypothetical protein